MINYTGAKGVLRREIERLEAFLAKLEVKMAKVRKAIQSRESAIDYMTILEERSRKKEEETK